MHWDMILPDGHMARGPTDGRGSRTRASEQAGQSVL